MNKQSDFLGNFGKGAIIGGATSAAIVLARDFVHALEDAKAEKKRRHPHTDANTIVINIPKQLEAKAASAREGFENVPALESKTISLSDTSRDVKGRFTPAWLSKAAQTKPSQTVPWLTALVAGMAPYMEKTRGAFAKLPGLAMEHSGDILGAAGGTVLGYLVIRKLHDNLEKKRLEREIAEAQQEYVDLLQKKSEYDILKDVEAVLPAVKSAEVVQLNGDTGGLVQGIKNYFSTVMDTNNPAPKPTSLAGKALQAAGKSVDDQLAWLTENAGGWVGGATLATTTLLALTTAYVTKKLMDKKFGDSSGSKAKFTPKQTKILFKTSADHSFQIEPETALAALFMIKAAQEADPTTPTNAPAATPPAPQPEAPAPAETTPPPADAPKPEKPGQVVNLDHSQYVDFLSDKDKFTNVMDILSGNDKHPVWSVGYMNTLKGLQGLSDKDRMAVMGQAITKNPQLVTIMNDPKYNQYISGIADRHLDNYFSANGSGFGKAVSSGWLGKTGLGSLLKALASWFYNSTALGRNMRTNRMLGMMGVDPSTLTKTSQDITSLARYVPSLFSSDDEAEQDISPKIRELIQEISNPEEVPEVSVTGSGKDAKAIAEKKRQQILQAVQELNKKYQ